MDRIATFQSFIDGSPDDPFPRYGLAMEYRTQGRLDDAVDTFAALVDRFPAYVASYLMYGNTLVQLGKPDEAKDIYRRGIDAATAAGDLHTRGELQAALADLT